MAVLVPGCVKAKLLHTPATPRCGTVRSRAKHGGREGMGGGPAAHPESQSGGRGVGCLAFALHVTWS